MRTVTHIIPASDVDAQHRRGTRVTLVEGPQTRTQVKILGAQNTVAAEFPGSSRPDALNTRVKIVATPGGKALPPPPAPLSPREHLAAAIEIEENTLRQLEVQAGETEERWNQAREALQTFDEHMELQQAAEQAAVEAAHAAAVEAAENAANETGANESAEASSGAEGGDGGDSSPVIETTGEEKTGDEGERPSHRGFPGQGEGGDPE